LATEEGLIDAFLRHRPRSPAVPVDIGDDAAVRADGSVITVDTLVEGIHFRSDAAPFALGGKMLAVSVSDVAAMGAVPRHAVISVSSPAGRGPWLGELAKGLGKACATYEVDLIGGDTTGSPGPCVLSLTLLGELLEAPWRRSGARPGDHLLVTGTLGLAGAGWMDPAPSPAATDALATPRPPWRLPRAFHRAGVPVHAAMDLSDGLATDAPRMAAASQVALHIDPHALPAVPEVASRPDRLRLQVCGGEDYQLLLAVPAAAVTQAKAVASSEGIPLCDIGEVRAGTGAHLIDTPWPGGAFRHFGASP